tara:strand:+ start:102 stop:527 length:426 start_codon:yes stop_codon:yes gene_type:complete
MKKYLFIILFVGVWSCEKNKLTEPNDNEDSITVLDTIRFADLTNLFKNQCYQCHSESSLSFYNLNFDSYESTMAGSINGPVVTPFKPFESLLYIKCTENFSENLSLNNAGKRMPEDNPDFFNNNPEKLKLIFDWIEQGCLE